MLLYVCASMFYYPLYSLYTYHPSIILIKTIISSKYPYLHLKKIKTPVKQTNWPNMCMKS